MEYIGINYNVLVICLFSFSTHTKNNLSCDILVIVLRTGLGDVITYIYINN